jgi:1-acyl-sn-glycerol-3-phosphate acyltransferase
VKNRLVSQLRFLVVNYVLGPALGIFVCLLEAFGRIKFLHFDRFPLWEGKLVMVSNHPSLFEPFILPLAGFPWMNFPWLFSPLWTQIKFSLSWFGELQKEFSLSRKLIPANVPDNNNFYGPPYWAILRGINVPIDRNGSAHATIGTTMALKRILESGGRVLIFPEGSRTFKAIQKSGAASSDGKKLGKLKDGAAWLAIKTNARILPIWVEGADKVLPNNKFPFPRLWHRVIVKFGTPFSVKSITRQEASSEITQALLELADET